MANPYEHVFIINNGKVVEMLSVVQFIAKVNSFYTTGGYLVFGLGITTAMFLYLRRHPHLMIKYDDKYWKYNEELGKIERVEGVGL